MKELDPHVQSILKWQESMVLMNEVSFFELMRSYLGQILTPYNKKKLIEELSAFMKNSENREKMLLMLSSQDKELLSAINFITDCTADKLTSFFSDEFTQKELYEKLSNLEERLFIFSHLDERSGKKIISITPYLTDLLKDTLKMSYIIPKAKVVSENKEQPTLFVTGQLIASLLSFVQDNSDLFKQDGTFKKKTLEIIETVFPKESSDMLHDILISLWNLSVLKKDSETERFLVDFDKAKRFAEMPPKFQNAFLCVSLTHYTNRGDLQESAQLFLDTSSLIPEEGFTLSSLLKSAFLIKEKLHEHSLLDRATTSRFSRMLSSREKEETSSKKEESESDRIKKIFETAIKLNLLLKKGENEKGEAVYVMHNALYQNKSADKVLSIDSSFSAMLMPGLSLSEMLPLVKALCVRHFDTVTQFELTRKCAMYCFDNGMTAESLYSLLLSFSAYELPQNIKVSIEEWFKAYNSATLYQGFVLQVSEEKEKLIEQNRRLSEHIRKKLASGVFLMDFSSKDDAFNILKRNNFEFVGKIDADKKENFILPYPILHENNSLFALDEITAEKDQTDKQEEYLQSLKVIVEGQRLEKDVKNELLSRIDRKMITSEKQLSPGCVRLEKLEAGSMDYFGKVHVIEHSIETKAMLEIEISGETISGTPLQLDKKGRGTEAVLTLAVNNDEENKASYLVSSLLHVKLIRGAIFPL